MPKIFISYRREDSADAAGRLRDRLAREVGFFSTYLTSLRASALRKSSMKNWLAAMPCWP
ncbi:MAG: hypothetical protein H7X91_04875 [Burkholderiales bacterium]|nr:hypothetical protein [Burkholderiales bacterium]